MPMIAVPGTIKRGDLDHSCQLRMPHVIPTRAAARGDNGAPDAGAPDVDPQERIDSLFVHLGTGTQASPRARPSGGSCSSAPTRSRARRNRAGSVELGRQLVHPLALLLWVAAALSPGQRQSDAGDSRSWR